MQAQSPYQHTDLNISIFCNSQQVERGSRKHALHLAVKLSHRSSIVIGSRLRQAQLFSIMPFHSNPTINLYHCNMMCSNSEVPFLQSADQRNIFALGDILAP